ncbi:MAG: hypothetical protein M1269_08695, partial [Chloroflexi bacterium]|nr:hypothetical protein [Chloroflexota bacterium]
REKKGVFQFLINGMIITDNEKPKDKRDVKEYDVIELIINDNNEAECWIYACSIANDYRSKDKEAIEDLAKNIHELYPDLKIRTRYIIQKDKANNLWEPKEEETGVGSWNS